MSIVGSTTNAPYADSVQLRLLQQLTDNLPVGVVQIGPTGRVILSNARVGQLTGAIGCATINAIFSGVDTLDAAPLSAALRGVLDDATDAELAVTIRPRSNSVIRCRVRLRALSDDRYRPNGALICIDDVTDGARTPSRLDERTTFDALTHAHSRESIMIGLEAALVDAHREVSGVAAIAIGLDDFRSARDRHGPSAGDELVRRVAACLRQTTRENDLVGRIGADEFLVIGCSILAPSSALALAERFAHALGRICDAERLRHTVASIGVTWSIGIAPGDTAAAREAVAAVVKHAESAIRESKAQGLGRPVFHTLHLRPTTRTMSVAVG
jgi:diguanylate cyclase (GGDEF)-like protein